MVRIKEEITDTDVLSAYQEADGNKTQAARYLGLSRSAYCRRYDKIDQENDEVSVEYAEEPESLSIKEEDEDAVLIMRSSEQLTAEEVAVKAGFDLKVWRIKSSEAKQYQCPMKLRQAGGSDRPSIVMLWYVSVKLERIMPKVIYEGMRACMEDWVSRYSPKYPQMTYKKVSDPHLLEISIADAHFGKLAWDKETGHDCDLDKAALIYKQAFTDLLNKAQGYKIEKITIPLGNDLFHIDNRQGTTERGTIVDYDSRYPKIVKTVQRAVVEAIDLALEVAPVEVVHVPGNHDRTVCWHLSDWLNAHYDGRCKHVTVDVEPRTRKYMQYGRTLLGWTHGDQEKHADLPLIMATEVPDLWAKSLHREIHLGHLHKRKQVRYLTTDTHHSVTVRILPSISATDYWHYCNGYVGSSRAAEAYLYSKEDCYVGHFSSNVRN